MIRTIALFYIVSRFLIDTASGASFDPAIPKTWEDKAMSGIELPLHREVKRDYPPAEYYYRIPARRIYKSYPVYQPDKEPGGYFEMLRNAQPELLWDDKGTRPKLLTEADWIRAGELVFDEPVVITSGSLLGPTAATNLFVREKSWYQQTEMPTNPDGVVPFLRYIVREPGKVELGALSCAMCHTRIMPDGSIIRGAQGNFPFSKAFAYEMRHPAVISPAYSGMIHGLYTAPWTRTNQQEALSKLSLQEIAAHFDIIPAGVIPRHGTGSWSPVQIPDLIGVKDRRYLDRTGLQRHRGPLDMMRYAALNQGLDALTAYNGVLLSGQTEREPAERFFHQRYSDEQLYALTMFVYALKPPRNPYLPKTPEEVSMVERGRTVFMNSENRCSSCHDPKQGYTNNKLVAAPGFEIPEGHPERENILRERVNTDADLTMTTRRGTGLYKVPSLAGIWYRGPLEHNGSCATLEDWFDSSRLRDDYVPTGWRGPLGTKTRAVKGHEFGLDLSEIDKKSLLAFLRTL